MKRSIFQYVSQGILLVALMALATSLTAQTSAEATAESTAESTADEIGLATECQAMAAKKQAMGETRQDMDAKLDALVQTMNAAGSSTAQGAMKPMAAVITELVAQRKADHAMRMAMEPEMMRHMMRHNAHKGVHPASHHAGIFPNAPSEWTATKGAMDCPMVKTPAASGAQGGEMTP